MGSFGNIQGAIEALVGCKGAVTAKDAKTGEEKVVAGIENRSDGMAQMAVRFGDGQERCFRAQYDGHPEGLGSYFTIEVSRPPIPGCEPTEIKISDNGQVDYEVCNHGSGSYGPELALTLVNAGAEERNSPIVAAWTTEQERLREERRRQDRETYARQEAERLALLEARTGEISSQLVGKRVTGVDIEARSAKYLESLVLTLEDGSSLKIRTKHDRYLEIERQGS